MNFSTSLGKLSSFYKAKTGRYNILEAAPLQTAGLIFIMNLLYVLPWTISYGYNLLKEKRMISKSANLAIKEADNDINNVVSAMREKLSDEHHRIATERTLLKMATLQNGLLFAQQIQEELGIPSLTKPRYLRSGFISRFSFLIALASFTLIPSHINQHRKQQNQRCTEAFYRGEIPWFIASKNNDLFNCDTYKIITRYRFKGLTLRSGQDLDFRWNETRLWDFVLKEGKKIEYKGWSQYNICETYYAPSAGKITIYGITKSGERCRIGERIIHKDPREDCGN